MIDHDTAAWFPADGYICRLCEEEFPGPLSDAGRRVDEHLRLIHQSNFLPSVSVAHLYHTSAACEFCGHTATLRVKTGCGPDWVPPPYWHCSREKVARLEREKRRAKLPWFLRWLA